MDFSLGLKGCPPNIDTTTFQIDNFWYLLQKLIIESYCQKDTLESFGRSTGMADGWQNNIKKMLNHINGNRN